MSEEKFEAWAIVDLFGHTRVAGLVTEQQVGGCNFVRVDIPGETPAEGHTVLYGQNSIYAIRFVSENVARLAARNLAVAPVSVWDLPTPVRQALADFRDAEDSTA